MKKVLVSILVAAPLMAGCTTTATRQAAADPYAYKAIKAADFATAESRLLRESSRHPNEPSAMLNLAFVYAATGRTSDASALYRRALTAPNVLMDVPGAGEPGWSHDIAAKGLRRAPVMASR